MVRNGQIWGILKVEQQDFLAAWIGVVREGNQGWLQGLGLEQLKMPRWGKFAGIKLKSVYQEFCHSAILYMSKSLPISLATFKVHHHSRVSFLPIHSSVIGHAKCRNVYLKS